jgi:hypothetical protein
VIGANGLVVEDEAEAEDVEDLVLLDRELELDSDSEEAWRRAMPEDTVDGSAVNALSRQTLTFCADRS